MVPQVLNFDTHTHTLSILEKSLSQSWGVRRLVDAVHKQIEQHLDFAQVPEYLILPVSSVQAFCKLPNKAEKELQYSVKLGDITGLRSCGWPRENDPSHAAKR